ncbi:nucleoside permease [Ancylomarina sp. 16SWW S1-10-2]|uniref:nucleoside permease n=1 Tax=Ancylomarina sp. 16SWW S1-10-2 TaxID=2499681 RepID=UPI0012AE47F6|nr:nucleoside permease [Ancylomarina sp. 16SWW S1-10-2]MRT91625.1 MFS transporter [Ancylomarina sp. 16SWW S1-10-2]
MGIKGRLTLFNFLQFFIWGAWLITIANYWFGNKGWSPQEFGAVFSTMGISSLFMPTLTGIIADRWMNAEKLYGILHLLGGAALLYLPQVDDPTLFITVILLAMICYMPTIALMNSISYTILKNHKYDVIKVFPPIRVWGTIGFIAAMWVTNLTGSKATENQFYIGAIASFILAAYSFTMPACKPQNNGQKNTSLVETLGLNAFKLFKNRKMALFFVFSMFLGAALQLTNMYGDTFLSDFGKIPEYADSFVIRYSTIIMSISQISETLFILAIPFFLKKFGIKKVMLISMVAWVLRFGLFAYGDPSGGLWMIILSCIIYGMAFDFFNISGSLFVETQCDPSIRSSAQGLFMMMTNGFGAIVGSWVSGIIIGEFFTSNEGNFIWMDIWNTFAIYSLIIAVLFAIFFKHKHNPEVIDKINQ